MASTPTTPSTRKGDSVSSPEPDTSQPAPVQHYIVTGAFVGINGNGDHSSAFLYRGSRVPTWATPEQVTHLLAERLIEPIDSETFARTPREVGSAGYPQGDLIPRLIVNED